MNFMQYAILEAQKASVNDEIPVGAVIVKNNEIIASACNDNALLGHAELKVIKSLNSRLDDCDIYVTLEPCPMCGGAIMLSRLRRVYFGAYNRISGCFGTVLDISPTYNHKIEIYGGIMEEKCKDLLTDFFYKKREM